MKRIIIILVCLLMSACVLAYADTIDLSGMTYDELVALKDQINLAMWNSDEWQEVTVPVGVWTVGEDIPVGHWSISIAPESSRQWVVVKYCDLLNEAGTDAGNQFYCKIYAYETIGAPDNDNYPQMINLDVKAGTYIIVQKGSVLFTPYQGKPSLGFK